MPIIQNSFGVLVALGAPLTYPDWFSALDRALIDDARARAARTSTMRVTEATRLRQPIAGPVRGLYETEADAVEAVLSVHQAIVRVLADARPGSPDRPDRHAAAARLFDQVVVWVARLTPSITTMDAFVSRIVNAREASAWWRSFALPPSAPTVAVTPVAPAAEATDSARKDDEVDDLLSRGVIVYNKTRRRDADGATTFARRRKPSGRAPRTRHCASSSRRSGPLHTSA